MKSYPNTYFPTREETQKIVALIAEKQTFTYATITVLPFLRDRDWMSSGYTGDWIGYDGPEYIPEYDAQGKKINLDSQS